MGKRVSELKNRAQRVRDQLDDIQDRCLIYPQGNVTVYESVTDQYELIDIGRLCDILGDNGFDWHASKKDYLGE